MLKRLDIHAEEMPCYGMLRAIPERSVEHYRRQLEAVCNNATLALFIMDERQQCTYMNPAAERLTGYTLPDVLGRALHDVIHHTHPDGTAYPMKECPIDRALPEENQMQGEDVFVHKDGRFYPVAYTASPLRDGDRLVGTIIEVRDITSDKQIEQQREEHLRKLRELDQAKTAFFSSVSHEFRTPLMLMMGSAEEALSSPSLSGEERERWGLLRRHMARLIKLVNTLLDFARIEAGGLRGSYQPTDLSGLTRQLSSLFSSTMERAGLRFEIDCSRLPEPIFVDQEMWEKIVLNLISNALKFTLEGEISVTLRQAGDRVELAVLDTGCGIPEEELPRLFDRFHQVRGSRARTQEGAGIGLALVKELAEMHGGQVSAESRLGQGTTFRVTIPTGSAHLAPEQIIKSVEACAPSPGASTYVEAALGWMPERIEEVTPEPAANETGERERRSRILVADDNTDVRRYLARVLGARWDVETAVDGEEALAVIRKRRPDLVFSDVMMPRLDGIGLLRQIRANPTTQTLPVVLVSARAGEEATEQGLGMGANDYIVKPFSRRELLARLAAQLEIARVRDDVAKAKAAQASAEAAIRAKDEFLAILGHELRNPLAPIFTAVQLLRLKGAETAFGRECMVIDRQAKHLTRLVDDLLDVLRITRGKFELQKERLELGDAVARAIETVSPLLESKRHHLDFDVARPLQVEADPTRLVQIIANLLTNAAKYTDPGGHIQVVGRCEGDDIVLRVQDNGTGLTAELLPVIFDMFVQAPQNIDRSQGGLGLGLSLVKNLVALHGGKVSAESEGLGKGSCIIVRLPAPSVKIVEEKGGLEGSKAKEGPRVLVVDDNRDAADLMMEGLMVCGYTAQVAYDGRAAISIAHELKPAFALLDIGLPGMSGYNLCRRLREELPYTRFIAVTGYGQESDREQAREAGFDRLMVKPVEICDVLSLLEELGREAKI